MTRIWDVDSDVLQELVDLPGERLDVEYKAWMDLSNKENRANIARHLCALANFGGGFLVFGINDDETSCGRAPTRAGPYDQDELSGIVKRYLVPAFQPNVRRVLASTGVEHVVVRVPSHDVVPVCSLRDGPNGGGIQQGTHYTRAPGPESVPIAKPELWAPIIRRCVIHERKGLLAGLNAVLRSEPDPRDRKSQLEQWHGAARDAYLSAMAEDRDWGRLKDAFYQLSYEIVVDQGEAVEMGALLDELRRVGHRVTQFLDSGWPMFHVFRERGLDPQSRSDEDLGEFLECRLLGRDRTTRVPAFWRVSPRGLATVARPYYAEDTEGWIVDGPVPQGPGTWFWLAFMSREVVELLRHAREFAGCFDTAEAVRFRMRWCGLADRTLADPGNPLLMRLGHVAREDDRTITRSVGITALERGWAELASGLVSSVARMFDARYTVSASDVERWVKEGQQ